MTQADAREVVESLYDGVLDDDAWARSQRGVMSFLDAPQMVLFSTNPLSGEVFRYELHNLDPAAMEAYSTHWIHHDPRHSAGILQTSRIAQTDSTLVDVREFRKTVYYNEFAIPHNVEVLMASWIDRRDDRGVVISLPRAARQGLHTQLDRDRLNALIPHLRRTLAIKDRLLQLRVPASSLMDVMDRLPFGLLLLGSDLRIIEASRIATQLMQKRDGITSRQGMLRFRSLDDDAAFGAHLKSALNPDTITADALHIQRGPGLKPLLLVPVPVSQHCEGWMSPGVRWLVLVFTPDSDAVTGQVAVQQLLGLTGAEAALVQCLVDGKSVHEAAAALEISVHTARTQLKSVYAKTGLNSQAKLTKKVLTGPALLGNFIR